MQNSEATSNGAAAPRWPLILLPALSLSIGWGIRGNFGHEWGAMIPGALAAIAAVLLSGRADWIRRVAYFGAFGAIGWSFGGSMSYGKVIAYAHSPDSLTVLYGFFSLFVIGFLWGAMGGAGTALPAFLTRERLTEFFPPLIAIYVSWTILEFAYEPLNVWAGSLLGKTYIARSPEYRHEEPLYWFDTDWTSALAAIVALLVFACIRRRWDEASSLMMHMALGWWAAFLLFPVLLGIRMTPPRGDSWAGCVGMVVGMWVYLQRNGLSGVTFASLVTGFIGGFGFASGVMFKLIELTSGLETNWHSILEQTYGFINGIGIAVTMILLTPRAPRVSDDPPVRRWTDWLAAAVVLLYIPYVNLQKNPETWVKAKAMADHLYWLTPLGWFNIGYLALAAAVLYLMIQHMRRPLPIVPPTWVGKGQLLYVLFLWWMVAGNFERALVSFAEQRLVTEGVILINAVLATLMVLLCPPREAREASDAPPEEPPHAYTSWIGRVITIGLIGGALSILINWGVKRAIYGDRHAPQAGLEIRFGPNATTSSAPRPGQPHP